MTDPAAFAATLVTLLAAHSVADHWIQTDKQATTKGNSGWTGRLADARHVATYTATLAAALLLVGWRTGIDYSPAALAIALGVNAISHYWADRRVHLRALAVRVGKRGWVEADPGAMYQLDQSWHIGWLLVTALILV